MQVGPATEQMLFILKMKDEASKVVDKFKGEVKDLGKEAKQSQAGLTAAGSGFAAIKSNATSLLPVLGRIAGPLAIVTAGAAAAKIAFLDGAQAVEEFERSQRRLQSVLETTGYASGVTKQQVMDLTDELEKSTLFDDTQISKAATSLAVIGNVAGENFERALKSGADLATIMDTDITNATEVLGRALGDPERGFDQLRRAGIIFTAAQKDAIKTLAETGQTAKAQGIILDVLAGKIGGLAEKEVAGLTGASNNLEDAWDDVLKTFGNIAPLVAVKGMLTDILGLIASFGKTQPLIEQLQEAEEILRGLKEGVPGDIFGTLQSDPKAIADAEQQVILLRDQLKAGLELGKQERDRAAAGVKAAADRTKAEAEALRLKQAAEQAAKDAAAQAKKDAQELIAFEEKQREIEQDALDAMAQRKEALRADIELTQQIAALQGMEKDAREQATAALQAQADARKGNYVVTQEEIDLTRQLVAVQQEQAAKAKTFAAGFMQVQEQIKEDATNNAQLVLDGYNSLWTGLDRGLDNFVETGKLKFRDLANGIIADLGRIALKAAASKIFGLILGAVGGGTGSGTGLVPIPNVTLSAKGMALENGVKKFRRGGIVDRPLLFPMAKGAGLMGEAGPEGVLPLKRMPGGDLGVQSSGSGGTNISFGDINIAVPAGTDPKDAEAIGQAVSNALEAKIVEVIGRQKRSGGILAGGFTQ